MTENEAIRLAGRKFAWLTTFVPKGTPVIELGPTFTVNGAELMHWYTAKGIDPLSCVTIASVHGKSFLVSRNWKSVARFLRMAKVPIDDVPTIVSVLKFARPRGCTVVVDPDQLFREFAQLWFPPRFDGQFSCLVKDSRKGECYRLTLDAAYKVQLDWVCETSKFPLM